MTTKAVELYVRTRYRMYAAILVNGLLCFGMIGVQYFNAQGARGSLPVYDACSTIFSLYLAFLAPVFAFAMAANMPEEGRQDLLYGLEQRSRMASSLVSVLSIVPVIVYAVAELSSANKFIGQYQGLLQAAMTGLLGYYFGTAGRVDGSIEARTPSN